MIGKFQKDDYVLLIYDARRRWMKKIEEKEFHCNYGMVNLIELENKPFGFRIQTSKGKWLRAIKPTLMDWFDFFEHGSQIIYQKDAAMIPMLLDIAPGDTVFEAGTGSGALTSVLSRAVGPNGRVVTHEVRESAHNTAKRNHEKIGSKNVIFKLQDITVTGFTKSIDEEDVMADSLILDMGDPWRAIPKAIEILKPGGRIVIFIPTFQQLERMFENLTEYNFKSIRALELLEREIQLKHSALRPSTRMIGHTGYLMHASWMP